MPHQAGSAVNSGTVKSSNGFITSYSYDPLLSGKLGTVRLSDDSHGFMMPTLNGCWISKNRSGCSS